MGFDYSRSNHRWRRKREQILKRDGHLCQMRKRYGLRVPAEIVHHIWPAEDYPEYAYEDWNLISLCVAAHDELHDRTSGRLSAKGLALKSRTPPGGAAKF